VRLVGHHIESDQTQAVRSSAAAPSTRDTASGRGVRDGRHQHEPLGHTVPLRQPSRSGCPSPGDPGFKAPRPRLYPASPNAHRNTANWSTVLNCAVAPPAESDPVGGIARRELKVLLTRGRSAGSARSEGEERSGGRTARPPADPLVGARGAPKEHLPGDQEDSRPPGGTPLHPPGSAGRGPQVRPLRMGPDPGRDWA
jgi:hypothetical protein